MKKEDIKNVAAAWQQVQEATAKQRALASIKPQPKDKVSLAPAPFDIPKKAEKMPIAKKEEMSSKEKMAKGLYASKKEAMDPVDKKELKGKHADRDDKDIEWIYPTSSHEREGSIQIEEDVPRLVES